MADKPKKKRLQFDVSSAAYDDLAEMKERTKASSLADLFRSAIRLYKWFLDQRKDGWKIQLYREGDDRVRQVELLMLEEDNE